MLKYENLLCMSVSMQLFHTPHGANSSLHLFSRLVASLLLLLLLNKRLWRHFFQSIANQINERQSVHSVHSSFMSIFASDFVSTASYKSWGFVLLSFFLCYKNIYWFKSFIKAHEFNF